MKFSRQINWAVSNLAFSIILYFAISGVSGAQNVAVFWVWWSAIVWGVVASSKDASKKICGRGRSVPGQLSHLVGFCYISVFVWHGWAWSAAAMVVAEMCEASVFNGGDETRKESAA